MAKELSEMELSMAEGFLEGLIAMGGDVTVNCLEENDNRCTEGFCHASISRKDKGFFLVTGIIPNADFLGDANFQIHDIVAVDLAGSEPSITAKTYNHNRPFNIIRISH